jgi:hypothetical protein
MESVNFVCFGHNGHRWLGVSFRHDVVGRGVVAEAAFGAFKKKRAGKSLGSCVSFCS